MAEEKEKNKERRQHKAELEMAELSIQMPKELVEELGVRAMLEERRLADIIIELTYDYLNR